MDRHCLGGRQHLPKTKKKLWHFHSLLSNKNEIEKPNTNNWLLFVTDVFTPYHLLVLGYPMNHRYTSTPLELKPISPYDLFTQYIVTSTFHDVHLYPPQPISPKQYC